MNRPSILSAAFVVAIGAAAGASAQTPVTQPVPAGGGAMPKPVVVAASAPSPAPPPATPKHRKPRKTYPAPGVAGATGGSYEASSRTPGGPPPGLKTGVTFPIPSIGNSDKK